MSHGCAFEHLDGYHTAIETEVAEPVLVIPATVSVPDVIARLSLPTPRRWPPPIAAPRFPLGGSLLADHCRWMLGRLPMDYVIRYWERSERTVIPGIAHLHFLYGADCPGLPVQHYDPEEDDGPADGPVGLPTDLCLCDCPLLAAADATGGNTSEDASVVALAAHCIAAAVEWTPFPDDAFPMDATNPIALLGDHWPEEARAALTAVLRAADRRTPWLVRLFGVTGVASDLPVRLMQFSVVRYAPERLPNGPAITVGWHVARAAAYGTGPLAGLVPLGAMFAVHGFDEEVASPAWRAVASFLRGKAKDVRATDRPIIALCLERPDSSAATDVLLDTYAVCLIGPVADQHHHPSCQVVWPRLDLALLTRRSGQD